MESNQQLDDQWQTRDLPVLLAACTLLDAGEAAVYARDLAGSVELEAAEIDRALFALVGHYLDGGQGPGRGSRRGTTNATGITPAGRRAAGLWPDEDAERDRLVGLLTQAAGGAGPEDASKLRKAADLLKSVPGAIISDVTAALIRQSAGL